MVTYKGKEIGFKRTVGAISEIAKLAPGGNIERLGEIFSENDMGTTIESGAHFLAILNKWYEKSLVFTEQGYKPEPIPADWFMMLDMNDYMELLNKAMKQFEEDNNPTIETVEPKGKKN